MLNQPLSDYQRRAGVLCGCRENRATAPESAPGPRRDGETHTGKGCGTSPLVLGGKAQGIEDMLAEQLSLGGIAHEREYRFDPVRRWRADFYIRPCWLVEVEGMLYQGGGRHQTYDGMEKDAEKYNAAILAGFKLLRFSGRQVRSGVAFGVIQDAVK